MIETVKSWLGLGDSRAVAKAEENLAVVTARGPRLEQAAAAARRERDAAEADVSTKQADLTGTEDAYAENQSRATERAVSAAREALEFARLRVRKPKAACETAERALDAWRVEVNEAEAALERARHGQRLAECRDLASLEGFNKRAAVPFEQLRAAIEVIEMSAEALQDLLDESKAAASELTAAGEPTEPIADWHLLAPLVLEHAEEHPERAGGLLEALPSIANCCRKGSALELAPVVRHLHVALRGPIFDELEKPRNATQSEYQAVELKRLRAALGARTTDEALAAAAAHADEVRAISKRLTDAREAAAAARHKAEQAANEQESAEMLATREEQKPKRIVHAAGAADEHFAKIAPPSDHFERLNS